jgi:hypothetical protein
MSGPALKPRAALLENGRWRAEVTILDPWGGPENVFLAGVRSSQDAALALAQRLVEAASVEPVPIFETPAPWK